tara:strand:- start:2903 stop:3121 length:219 start_codon:yes stop_codon:yes gene_type:complete
MGHYCQGIGDIFDVLVKKMLFCEIAASGATAKKVIVSNAKSIGNGPSKQFTPLTNFAEAMSLRNRNLLTVDS